MTIASEITNYANGLGDAYDAVNDMGGVIPQDKNMNNLDTAIRTIPQTPSGHDITFFFFDETTRDLYKEDTYTTVATHNDVEDAYLIGVVVIKDGELNTDIGNEGLTVTGYDSDSIFCVLSKTADGQTWDVRYTYDALQTPKWSRVERKLQPELTAGSNISINSVTHTISATDTTYSDFTGATSSVAGAHGLVPAPTTSDPDKFLKGDGTWANPDIPDVKIIYTDSYISTMVAGDDFNMYPDPSCTTPYTYNEAHNILYSSAAVILQDQDSSRMLLSYDGEDFMYGFCYSANGYRAILLDAVSSGYTPGYNAHVFFAYDLDYVMVGATSSGGGYKGMVPAPAPGDQGKALLGDGTWGDPTAKLVEMSYGEANAWAKFIAAYNAGSIVYCRASSNANPGSGAKTRKAFMAYVNNETNPTNVEFQYVRSVSSKTSSQPVDQVYVYKLESTNGGTWSVATRDMAPKLAAGAGISVSYNNGTYTISLA